MAAPKLKSDAEGVRPDDVDAPSMVPTISPWWWILGRCLTATSPDTLPQLAATLQHVSAAGAIPFEAITGTPHIRYGARVTVELTAENPLAELGLAPHPWGRPSWVGVRIAPGGALRLKSYHRLDRLDARFSLPATWPTDLYPIMASLEGDTTEIYLRKREPARFAAFAAACLAPIGMAAPDVAPVPRPRADAFAVSLRRERGRITAITVYADWRALPCDADIEREWSAGLDGRERLAYQCALAGVQSLGFLPTANWHAMLAWSADASGERHRAASLTIPRPPDRPVNPHTTVL